MEDESPGSSLQHSHHLHQHHHHLQNSGHHIQHRHVSSSVGDEGGEEEELDPRIQVELEKLNRATEEINRLELELDDARASFRQVLSDSSQRLNGLAKKLGTSVDKARPYYDSRMKLKEAHLESQKAALRFERACSMHEAAKEMVQLAEEGYKRREEDLDPTWQEMLNHATMKVNDAERERIESEDNHQSTTLNFKKREEEVQKLQRDLKRAITKSRPYFEMKAKFNQVMEDHKRNVSRLEEDVASTKALYSEALRNLEAISDDIHRQRLERRQKMELGIRGAGVGAESPSPPPSWDKGLNIDGSASHLLNSDGEEICGERAVRKRWKEQGIVGFDLPLCHQSSVSDDHDLDSLKSDPLNLVVFKTDSHHPPYHSSHSLPPAGSSYDNNNFCPPSVIRTDPRHARNHSYRQAIDTDINNSDGTSPRINDVQNDNNGHNSQAMMMPNNTSSLPTSTAVSLKSQQLRREVEAMQTSLSRAQEWVNKSPVPQQRRFIKSKSLIDASVSSSSSTTLSSSAAVAAHPTDNKSSASLPPSGSHQTDTLASSLTTEAMKIMASNARLREESDDAKEPLSPPQQQNLSNTVNTKVSSALSARLLQQQQEHQQQQQQELPTSDMGNISIQIQPHLQQPSLQASPSPPIQPHHLHHHLSKSSPRSVTSTTSDQSSPNSGSPSGKSPKLQGLILRVDAAGIIASPSPTSSPSSLSNNPYSKHQAVITTKVPPLGSQQYQTPTSHPHYQHIGVGGMGISTNSSISPSSLLPSSTSQKSPVLSSSPSPSSSSPHTTNAPNSGGMDSSSSSTVNTPTPTTTTTIITTASPPRPTLIPNTRSSSTTLSLGGFKFPSSSKSPQTSTAFLLPSPTQPRSTSLSIPPPLAIRQVISPTPPSPSGDRVSILSGRSDSSKGGLLRPPSDSSDTESIASTGPMLDDDQVEFLTLDFNEQSISSSAPQEEIEEGDMNDLDHSRLQRGNWSRMSLPPRLSYLGGYLERTRHAVAPVGASGCHDGDNLSPPPSSDDREVGIEKGEGSVDTVSNVEEGEKDDNKECASNEKEEKVENVDGTPSSAECVDVRDDVVIEGGNEKEVDDDDNNNGDSEVSVHVQLSLVDGKMEEQKEEEDEDKKNEYESDPMPQTEVEATVVVTGEGIEVLGGVEGSTDS